MAAAKKTKPAKAGTSSEASDVSKKVVENETKAATVDAKAKETVKAEPVKAAATVEKKAEPVKAEKKEEPAVKKPAAKRGRPKGSTTKKTAEKKPVTRKKAAKTEIVQEVYLEFGQHEPILTEKLVERIKEEWRNDGHRTSSIKSLRVYIKPEDHKAYYVINEKDKGDVGF